MADAALPPMLLPEEVAALRQRVAQLEAALTAQQHGEQRQAHDNEKHEQDKTSAGTGPPSETSPVPLLTADWVDDLHQTSSAHRLRGTTNNESRPAQTSWKGWWEETAVPGV